MVQKDLLRVFLEFHSNRIIKSKHKCNFHCPCAKKEKKSQTFKFSDLKSISLVTSLNNIIARVLSGHLRGMLNEMNFSSRGIFIKGR